MGRKPKRLVILPLLVLERALKPLQNVHYRYNDSVELSDRNSSIAIIPVLCLAGISSVSPNQFEDPLRAHDRSDWFSAVE